MNKSQQQWPWQSNQFIVNSYLQTYYSHGYRAMHAKNISVIEAMLQRFSTRAFIDNPVTRETVEAILDCARQAPSGGNLQPWQVIVLTGKTKDQLSAAILDAYDRGEPQRPEYNYYPREGFEPYKSRRIQTGIALYQALKIHRDDTQRRKQQWKANYHFFGAPVGLLFLIDNRLGQGSFVDLGIFLQSVMLTAMAYDLATCPQASLSDYPDIVRQHLQLPDNLLLVCGMALGFADMNRPVNQYRTEREAVNNFTTWYD